MKLAVESPMPTVELPEGSWTGVLNPNGKVVALFLFSSHAAGWVDSEGGALKLVSVKVPK